MERKCNFFQFDKVLSLLLADWVLLFLLPVHDGMCCLFLCFGFVVCVSRALFCQGFFVVDCFLWKHFFGSKNNFCCMFLGCSASVSREAEMSQISRPRLRRPCLTCCLPKKKRKSAQLSLHTESRSHVSQKITGTSIFKRAA